MFCRVLSADPMYVGGQRGHLPPSPSPDFQNLLKSIFFLVQIFVNKASFSEHFAKIPILKEFCPTKSKFFQSVFKYVSVCESAISILVSMPKFGS